MEILFMVFMVVVTVMALFAILVVLRDIVKEVLLSKREREPAKKVAKVEEVKPVAEPVAEPVVEKVAEPIVETVVEEPVAEPVVEEVVATDDESKVTFSTGQQTLDEKYLELSSEEKGWYDEVIKYASAVEGSKRFKNARYEEYKVGKNRLVRLLIKRGVINCEFILQNSNFRNYVNENKISVSQSATVIRIDSAATVDAVKDSINIVVAAINEEKEYKKQLAREKRKAANAKNANQ
jgi:hypothetical protein